MSIILYHYLWSSPKRYAEILNQVDIYLASHQNDKCHAHLI
ncbi:MAG: hypothetical protein ABIJ94_01170 [candidate division WOR-3 bacterium]